MYVAAAHAALGLLKHAKKDTFIFFLISGGGSAMMELPRDKHISLDDTIAFHETLVASGATITEVNTVRKYFSAIKGGRLALAAPEAEKLSLLLADVPLKDLAAVASSPTLPDYSTPAECSEILARFHLLEKFPPAVRAYFEHLPQNAADERKSTRDGQTGATAFEHAHFDTLLSNHDFVNAARDRAQELGYRVVIDNTCDDWDYADAAQYLLARFHELRRESPRVCLLSSGEVTVKLLAVGIDDGAAIGLGQIERETGFAARGRPGDDDDGGLGWRHCVLRGSHRAKPGGSHLRMSMAGGCHHENPSS